VIVEAAGAGQRPADDAVVAQGAARACLRDLPPGPAQVPYSPASNRSRAVRTSSKPFDAVAVRGGASVEIRWPQGPQQESRSRVMR
jgi:hypothetical protein